MNTNYHTCTIVLGLINMLWPNKSVAAIFLPGLVCTMFLASWPHIQSGSLSYSLGGSRSGRVLLELQDKKPPINVHVREYTALNNASICLQFFFQDPKDIIGYVLGCVSATFYLGSRLPQIIRNV